jgi:hypothetical protein
MRNLKHRLKEISLRKQFVSYLNNKILSQLVSDKNHWDSLVDRFGINKIFEAPCEDGKNRRFVLLTISNLPDEETFAEIRDSGATVICRFASYLKNGFTKTYKY